MKTLVDWMFQAGFKQASSERHKIEHNYEHEKSRKKIIERISAEKLNDYCKRLPAVGCSIEFNVQNVIYHQWIVSYID